MKRKSNSLIEIVCEEDFGDNIESPNKKSKMPSPQEWLAILKDAEKTSIVQNNLQKVHYKFNDNTEMVEEYHTDTYCVLRRAWKKYGKLGGEGVWEVEIGDPETKILAPNADIESLQESGDQPIISRRNTRINLEWRIRNLPYPIETYSLTAEEKTIVIRTSNKKYFKKLSIPELDRIGVMPAQENISFTHKFNTLIVTYKKPKELLDMEKLWLAEIRKIEITNDSMGDCKMS